MVGTTISHYKILEKLGEGGMGVVYKAEDTKLKRIVALKFLPMHLSASEHDKARFIQEAQAASALNHPNVCTVHDIQDRDGQIFIVMEYVDGQTLREKIRTASGLLSIQEVFLIASQIVNALADAHEKGIVHRDIKSENIMVTAKQQVKVMDFGLAKFKGALKLTRTASTVGTLAYMSPEQIQGEEADFRSDMFSFGVLLFELLTGKLPFRGEHEAAMMYSIVNEPPEPVSKYRNDVPPEFVAVIQRLLAKNPESRYARTEDLQHDLRESVHASGEITHDSGHRLPGKGSATISAPTGATGKLFRKRYVLVGVVALLLVLGYFLFPLRQTQETARIDSIAVLPFRNMSGDPNMEYLSDGITENLINALSRLQTMRVIPRSTVFHYKGKDDDAQKIGNELHVRAVLTGRVVQRGDDLNIQLELIDVQRQSQLWGDQYTQKSSQLLAVQDQMTRAVAAQLQVSGEVEKTLRKRSTENTEAYQLYLKGRYYIDKRSVVGFTKAIQYFQQALDLDPNFALAYTGLGDCYDLLGLGIYNGSPPGESLPKAKAALEKAFQLDSTLGEAYTTRAHLNHSFEWDWPRAEHDFRRAIELSPRYGSAHVFYAVYLNAMGRRTEAMEQFVIAQQMEPLSLPINTWLGIEYYYGKEYDKSLEQLRKTLDIDPTFLNGHYFIAWVYLAKNMTSDAVREMRYANEQSGGNPVMLAGLVYALAHDGQKAKAKVYLDTLLAESKKRFISPHNLAIGYLGVGDTAQFYHALGEAVDDHSFIVSVAVLRVDPFFDFARRDPRFISLWKKTGLPE
jgi:serine/threonine-protein kinase